MARLPMKRLLIALWGVLGVELLLVDALARLTPKALGPLLEGTPLPLGVVLSYLSSVAFMAYFEGYKGFQRAFAPRVAARALYLARHPEPLRVVLAPLFVMAVFGARTRRLIASWGLLVFIVGGIALVQLLPPLYRAAVDAGVVVGLSWGGVAVLVSFLKALWKGPAVDPELS